MSRHIVRLVRVIAVQSDAALRHGCTYGCD
jgi:hypothetical protein